MLKFLSSVAAVIFEDADIFKTLVSLEILNAVGCQQQELLDFSRGCDPQMAIVLGILHQHFVGSDGVHAIVQPVRPARRLAFDVVERRRMYDGAGGPRASRSSGTAGDDLRLSG